MITWNTKRLKINKTDSWRSVSKFEEQIVKSYKINPKIFYSYKRSKMKTLGTMGSLKNISDRLIDNSKETCE